MGKKITNAGLIRYHGCLGSTVRFTYEFANGRQWQT
jgi:hypothetical protein